MQWCCPESSNKIRVEILRSIFIKIKLSSTTHNKNRKELFDHNKVQQVHDLCACVWVLKKKRKAVMDRALHLCTCLQSRVYGNIMQHGHACSMSTKRKNNLSILSTCPSCLKLQVVPFLHLLGSFMSVSPAAPPTGSRGDVRGRAWGRLIQLMSGCDWRWKWFLLSSPLWCHKGHWYLTDTPSRLVIFQVMDTTLVLPPKRGGVQPKGNHMLNMLFFTVCLCHVFGIINRTGPLQWTCKWILYGTS